MVAPGRLTRQVARGRVVALAKATHLFIQDLLLRSENGLFSGISIASSSPKRGEAGTDESGDLLTDIFLVALIVAAVGEISSEMDRSSLCDIEKSSFKCFEIGLKLILPTQVHTQRITKTLLVHLPDL